ncbi:MAG: helix-turn-helix transcriptional regulator [Treponema sp.]|nr:helix-turn-helix transcriptional regulator [Treponema sp.]
MQVVAKKPRIDIHVYGKGVKAFLNIVKKTIPDVKVIDDDDEYQDIDEWDYYKEMKARLTPATVLKIRRENAGLTQAELAKKSGIASSNIALMETGKRNIGVISAKKLAAVLRCDAGDFVR